MPGALRVAFLFSGLVFHYPAVVVRPFRVADVSAVLLAHARVSTDRVVASLRLRVFHSHASVVLVARAVPVYVLLVFDVFRKNIRYFRYWMLALDVAFVRFRVFHSPAVAVRPFPVAGVSVVLLARARVSASHVVVFHRLRVFVDQFPVAASHSRVSAVLLACVAVRHLHVADFRVFSKNSRGHT